MGEELDDCAAKPVTSRHVVGFMLSSYVNLLSSKDAQPNSTTIFGRAMVEPAGTSQTRLAPSSSNSPADWLAVLGSEGAWLTPGLRLVTHGVRRHQSAGFRLRDCSSLPPRDLTCDQEMDWRGTVHWHRGHDSVFCTKYCFVGVKDNYFRGKLKIKELLNYRKTMLLKYYFLSILQ